MITVGKQLDTGATCNVISFNKLCEIKQTGKPVMQSTTAKVRLYDESLVQVLGECDLQCKFKGELHSLNFKVVSGTQQLLLSGETCTKMGLITVHVLNNVDVDRVYTDNGPQFGCAEYKTFACNWKFEHYTSSPYHA